MLTKINNTNMQSNLIFMFLYICPLSLYLHSLLETKTESEAAEAVLNCPWQCDSCEMALTLGPIERLQHRLGCGKSELKGMLSE